MHSECSAASQPTVVTNDDQAEQSCPPDQALELLKAACCAAAARYGQPEEVAGLVRFLASDPAAAYITGQVRNQPE